MNKPGQCIQIRGPWIQGVTHSLPRSIRLGWALLLPSLSFIILAAAACAPRTVIDPGSLPTGSQAPALVPIDPQKWQDQQDMTWDDYHPIPGVNWADPSLHPQDVTKYLSNDIYRLSVSVDGQGWLAQLQNALAAVKFGESKTVPVYVTRMPGSARSAIVTLRALSESDPTKITAATCVVSAGNPKRSKR